MTKTTSKDLKKDSGGGFTLGFLFGTLVGTGTYFLFGTKEGKRLRKLLAQESKKAKKVVEKAEKELEKKAKEAKQTIKVNIASAKEEADQALKETELKIEKIKTESGSLIDKVKDKLVGSQEKPEGQTPPAKAKKKNGQTLKKPKPSPSRFFLRKGKSLGKT